MNQLMNTSPVLTVEELGEYLRIPPEVIEREARRGRIPGRHIADTWRFLKSAIDLWLSQQNSRDLLLAQAGALADDDSLDHLLQSIYEQRGRAEIEPSAS